MVKVISELEKIGLSLTVEQKESIKKSMGEELYSKQELDKELSKTQELEEKNKELVGKQETLEKELQTMPYGYVDVHIGGNHYQRKHIWKCVKCGKERGL